MQPAGAQADRTTRHLGWLGWLIAIFGLTLLVIGVAATVQHLRDLAVFTGRTRGVVVDSHVSSAGNGRAFAPVVRFTTLSGESQEFTSALGTNPPRFKIGDQVTVAYDPADPGRAMIDSFWDTWYWSVVLGGPGLLFLLLGVVAAKTQFFGLR